ncbi:kinetochore-associated protein NNF1 [Echria macrotheca]|uniref:Kinetochore-associated protein NNF1 n=1 Tax=Echria macrotheca TaxID=438768 RepID=A0AAJ0FC86_9PEZI|nr:kinetochore-associated protein NNF1 [Echria macrotheca]
MPSPPPQAGSEAPPPPRPNNPSQPPPPQQPQETSPPPQSAQQDPTTQPQPEQNTQQHQEATEDQEDREDSPPLPERHTPITPGPRAARLQDVFGTALRRTLARMSVDNFGACYPTIAREAPRTLESVQRQTVERLAGLCEKEFQSILQSRNVIPRLNELEALLSDAATRRQSSPAGSEPPIPPHTLPAQTILQAHLTPHIAAQQSQISTALRGIQTENSALFGEVEAQRAEIDSLLDEIGRTLADMDAASALLSEVVEGLSSEGRGVDVEMD